MNLGDCTATIKLNGKIYEVRVCNVQLSRDSYNGIESVSIDGYLNKSTFEDYLCESEDGDEEDMTPREYVKSDDITIQLPVNNNGKEYAIKRYSGETNEKGEEDMDHKGLTEKYVELGLDDDTRVLRKAGIINTDGTLTGQGERFLLNVLLEQNKPVLVEALDEIKEADEEDE